MIKNNIEVVRLKGGLIGWIIDNPEKALEKKFDYINKAGYRVIQVIPASNGNLFSYLLSVLLLAITIGLFTIGSGYFVIVEKVE